MSDRTGIEWADATWNPVVGCSVVSPGCTNCYAMRQAARLLDKAGSHYAGTTRTVNGNAVWTGKVALAPDRILTQPLRWARGRRVFVNSMGDLFHESVPDAWIDRVFAVMALAPQHTFLVLTKRSARMRVYISDAARRIADAVQPLRTDDRAVGPLPHLDGGQRWYPLPNVWLGVSAEDQQRAAERIPDLLATPAAKRFVSCEPLLGPISLRRIRIAPDHHTIIDALDGYAVADRPGRERAMLDWIIAGGESGPVARPLHPDWVRGLRDQCVAAGVPFFFKQWGEWLPVYDRDAVDPDWRRSSAVARATENGRWMNIEGGHGFHGARVVLMDRVGKKRAGRLLDGRKWNKVPA